MGGRSRSQEIKGFTFNFGPHALYSHGEGMGGSEGNRGLGSGIGSARFWPRVPSGRYWSARQRERLILAR
jgi:hypothetical protein